MKKANHKPRSIKLFANAGYRVDICESRDPFKSIPNKEWKPGMPQSMKWRQIPGNTRDLFGLGDLFVVGHGLTALVQICSQTGVSAHKAKARANGHLVFLIDNGLAFLMVGWAKPNHRYVPRLWRAFVRQDRSDVWFHEFDPDALNRHQTAPATDEG